MAAGKSVKKTATASKQMVLTIECRISLKNLYDLSTVLPHALEDLGAWGSAEVLDARIEPALDNNTNA